MIMSSKLVNVVTVLRIADGEMCAAGAVSWGSAGEVLIL